MAKTIAMSSILINIENNVATLTLNRPDKLNSFNREMALLLQQKLDECNDNNEVRCVIITGAGKAFCAGQDLEEIVTPGGPTMQQILSEHYNPIITKIRSLQKPVIAAINGVAAGAGANIALCCDITIAAESVSFIQAFSKIGLIPDSGGTYFLPRLIGFAKASAFAMLGDKVLATDAEKMGMIYKVVSNELFEEEIKRTAATLATMPTKAFEFIKGALNSSMSNNLEAQLGLEDVLQQKAAVTLDFKEGVAAFLEKRKPVFTGN